MKLAMHAWEVNRHMLPFALCAPAHPAYMPHAFHYSPTGLKVIGRSTLYPLFEQWV